MSQGDDALTLERPSRRQEGLSRLFQAFRHKGFPLLWANTLFTSTGFWLEIIAQGWLALQLTGSPFWVGMVGGARGVGILCIGTLGGTVADRVDRRRLIITVQLVGMTVAFTISFLSATGLVRIWHLLIMAWVQGASIGFIMPARNSLVYDLVGRENLLSGMAANYWGMNLMRVIGPSAGGIILATAGVSGCYFFMGVSYAIGILAMTMVPRRHATTARQGSLWRDLYEGLMFAVSHPVIRLLLLTEVLMDTFAFSHMFMLPVFARDVLKVGPTGLGFLMSASGVGAMAAAAVVASLGDFRYKGRLLLGAMLAFGSLLILFSASSWYPLSLFLIALVGVCSATYDTTMSTLIQTTVPDELRGRVMGIYVFTWGMAPMGSFQAGAVGTLLSIPVAVGLGGGVIVAYAITLARGSQRIRGLR